MLKSRGFVGDWVIREYIQSSVHRAPVPEPVNVAENGADGQLVVLVHCPSQVGLSG
jgi:hypothetical protein